MDQLSESQQVTNSHPDTTSGLEINQQEDENIQHILEEVSKLSSPLVPKMMIADLNSVTYEASGESLGQKSDGEAMNQPLLFESIPLVKLICETLNISSEAPLLIDEWPSWVSHSWSWSTVPPVNAQETQNVLVISLFMIIFIYVLTRRRFASSKRNVRHSDKNDVTQSRYQQQRQRALSGMEVWRSTRDRASTFDFFGMHQSSSQFLAPSHGGSNKMISRSRSRTGSRDFFFRNELNPRKNSSDYLKIGTEEAVIDGNIQDEGYLYDEFGLVTLSFHVTYNGPSHSTLTYWTWTPPASWKEASRRIVPQDSMLKLQRKLIMDVAKSTITIQEPDSNGKWDFSLPMKDFSTHVIPPVEGGVLNLYVKGSAKEEWMEYTFESAHLAAQFQLDLLSFQVFGSTLFHMYQALSLVHQGSIAHEGQEFVLHDERVPEDETEAEEASRKPSNSSSGVAWDDAMRALSSIPSIRIALERLWLHHRNHGFPPSTSLGSKDSKKGEPSNVHNKDTSESAQVSLTDEYVNKRLLLGPVDFFRLFVPILPETAVLENQSYKSRMEQLLRWRKRAARAAVLIRAYTISHRITNHGWNIPSFIPADVMPFTKRLAYDDNDDNNRRDFTANNEYYEATVSRDVLCHVRPDDYFSESDPDVGSGGDTPNQRTSVLSPYQAFSLVGAQVFKLPTDDTEKHPIHHSRDPVVAIPSLQRLISMHPEVDFLVYSFYPKVRGVAVVVCYVRSLPKGIDPKFDNVMNRFFNGSKETRDRKLHLMIQLGPYLGLSFAGWAILRFLSFLLNLTSSGREAPVGLETNRSSFPAIRLADYARTNHFGGKLQTNPSMPKNYVSMSSVYHSKNVPNLLARWLFSCLENSSFTKNVLDFTFLLEGEQEDEVPERALSTIRMVHVDSEGVALPVSSDALKWETSEEPDLQVHSALPQRGLSNIVSQTLQGMVSRMGSSLRVPQTEIPESIAESRAETPTDSFGDALHYVDSNDPVEIAANILTDLLVEAMVPVRTDKLRNANDPDMQSSAFLANQKTEMICLPALDLVSRHDMKRFIVASNFDVKVAAVRLIETTAWRSVTFPIDTRKCRVELQNGQFFQQGLDLQGGPVFYFRNMCLGPWRRDVDSVISAVLYRLEKSLSRFAKSDPDVKCTLIIMMGWACRQNKELTEGSSEETTDVHASPEAQIEHEKTKDRDSDDDDAEVKGDTSHESLFSKSGAGTNPRIPESETWYRHTSKTLIYRLIDILITHYPERLSKALVLFGTGKKHYFGTTVGGRLALPSVIDSGETRSKVVFLKNSSDLTNYVSECELLQIVGGRASILPDAFTFG